MVSVSLGVFPGAAAGCVPEPRLPTSQFAVVLAFAPDVGSQYMLTAAGASRSSSHSRLGLKVGCGFGRGGAAVTQGPNVFLNSFRTLNMNIAGSSTKGQKHPPTPVNEARAKKHH